MRAFNDPIVDCCGRDAADCDCPTGPDHDDPDSIEYERARRTSDSPRYVATINVPGYLPMDDEPPVFDTAREAWEYLAEERRDQEDSAICDDYCDDPACQWRSEHDLTDTVAELEARASSKWLVCDFERAGTVYGDTPGYHGAHDLGLAYVVSEVDCA